MRNYINWVKDHWQKSAILILVYVIATLIPIYSRLELIDFLLLLPFPLYLIHEIEEYILPGGFAKFFNENLLNVDRTTSILPIDREVIFWINMLYIWFVLPLFTILGFYKIQFAAWIPYFFIFQAFSHLIMGIKGKMLINPGIRSSFLLHIPYAILMIYSLVTLEADIVSNPYFNIYMLIGFLFNGLLPLMAKFIILPRYKRRLTNVK